MMPIRYVLYVLYIFIVFIVSIVVTGIITIRLDTIAAERALDSRAKVSGGGENRD